MRISTGELVRMALDLHTDTNPAPDELTLPLGQEGFVHCYSTSLGDPGSPEFCIMDGYKGRLTDSHGRTRTFIMPVIQGVVHPENRFSYMIVDRDSGADLTGLHDCVSLDAPVSAREVIEGVRAYKAERGLKPAEEEA